MRMVTVEALLVTIQRDANAEIEARLRKAGLTLLRVIKQAYQSGTPPDPNHKASSFKVSRGGGGAVGSLTTELLKGQGFLALVFNLPQSHAYFRNLEFGESGTGGTPPGGAIFARGSAPPVAVLRAWVLQSGLSIPKYYEERAKEMQERAASGHKHPVFDKNRDKPWYSEDPAMQWAFGIGQTRKKFGRIGMRIIEKTMLANADKIRAALAGAS